MDNFNELKATWKKANTKSLPDVKTMMHIVKSFRDEKLMKKLWIIGFSLTASVFFAIKMYIDRFHMASTLIGEGFFVLSLLMLAISNIRSSKRFYNLNDCSNKEFINFLEQTRKNQHYFYTRTQAVCIAFYSIGILLYLFELVYKDMTTMLISYAATIALLTLYWAVVRPRAYHKEAAKLENRIQQTEALTQQFK